MICGILTFIVGALLGAGVVAFVQGADKECDYQ